MRTPVRALSLVLILLLLATACVGGGDDESADFADVASEPGEAFDGELREDDFTARAEEEAEPPAAPQDSDLGSGGVQPTGLQTAVDSGRQIIFTAELTVSVANVAAAGEEATRVIESHGGFLFGQQTTAVPDPVSVLVFRVPPAAFQQALRELGGIGELRTQNVFADDVTERVVDLESRITTAEASVDRLRTFLEGATDVEDIAQLEAELLERETTLERLRGELRTIRDRVDLATITLTLTEAGLAPQVRLDLSAYAGADGGTACPGDEGLSVQEGSDVTLCFQLRNEGDAPLSDFELTETVLGITLDDLVPVFGDPADVLQPGQDVVLAYETTVDRTLRLQARLEAVPLDTEGTPIPARQVSNVQSLIVFAEDPGGLPGFADGLAATWDFLKNVWGLIVLTAGLLLPVIWVFPLAWWLWRRRRRQREEPAITEEVEPQVEAEAED